MVTASGKVRELIVGVCFSESKQALGSQPVYDQ